MLLAPAAWTPGRRPVPGDDAGSVRPIDKTCDPKGSSRTANNIYGIDSFIHIDITPALLPTSLALDEHAILVGMHITTREITRWTWQTF